jgi:hypothetical protein
MDLAKIGAIKEARLMCEAMLNNPSFENFGRYRRALVKVATLFHETVQDAATRVNNSTEHLA